MIDKKIKKIVLAYSGGLDTTVILHWLKNTYDAEVIAFTADIGQDHNPEQVKDRANAIGVSKILIEDLKEDFTKISVSIVSAARLADIAVSVALRRLMKACS